MTEGNAMKTTVAIVRGENTEENVEKALTLIDIKSNLKMNNYLPTLFRKPSEYIDTMKLRKDSKILIKPNFVHVPVESPYANTKHAYELTTFFGRGKGTGVGDITTPEAISGVLKSLREAGYTNLVIGEAAGGCQTYLNYDYLGIYKIGKAFGAEVVDLNWEDAVLIDVPNRVTFDAIWVPRTVFEADLIVSVPAMKNGLSLKNVGIGTLPGKYYGWNRAGNFVRGLATGIHDSNRRSRLGETGEIVDVCSVNHIGLAVIDGTHIFDGEGVTHEANLVIAGFDPVATDAVAYAVMGFDPRGFSYMTMAEERGLGTCDFSKIEVRGESIEKVKVEGIAPPRASALTPYLGRRDK
ncbi:DUF362 domain-containing protein [Candidatus Bathyarchaeota archaeon]|nr:DUF362 domain-containing protein [Candidatus Bathyarchaeota archaeon]